MCDEPLTSGWAWRESEAHSCQEQLSKSFHTHHNWAPIDPPPVRGSYKACTAAPACARGCEGQGAGCQAGELGRETAEERRGRRRTEQTQAGPESCGKGERPRRGPTSAPQRPEVEATGLPENHIPGCQGRGWHTEGSGAVSSSVKRNREMLSLGPNRAFAHPHVVTC